MHKLNKILNLQFISLSKTLSFTGRAVCTAHTSTTFSSLDLILLAPTYSKTSLK